MSRAVPLCHRLQGVADPKNDRIYAAFTDKTNGMRIRFARSGNRGKTWQAVTVSDNPSLSDQFSPAIAVDSDSNVKITYYDTVLSSTAEAVHVFMARSGKGDSFDTERVTTISSNDSRSNPLRDYTANLGDRTAAAMTDGDVLVAWTDTRLDSEDVFVSVVFDPDGESMTGSGKILSPAGAFPANPALTGKAEFGFDAKYRKHSSVPMGDTEFSFVAGKFKFKFRPALSWRVEGGTVGVLLQEDEKVVRKGFLPNRAYELRIEFVNAAGHGPRAEVGRPTGWTGGSACAGSGRGGRRTARRYRPDRSRLPRAARRVGLDGDPTGKPSPGRSGPGRGPRARRQGRDGGVLPARSPGGDAG